LTAAAVWKFRRQELGGEVRFGASCEGALSGVANRDFANCRRNPAQLVEIVSAANDDEAPES